MALALLGLTACSEPCRHGAFEYRTGAVIEHRDQLEAYEGRCIIVLGRLDIRGRRIETLAGLEGIVGIHGALVIKSEALVSTAELASLQYVQGDLGVADAPSLERVELPSLRSVGMSLRLSNLPRLLDLDGFDALDHVGGSLALRELDAMSTIWLPALDSVGESVHVENNWQLEELFEPDTLFEIGGSLQVRSNPSLRIVTGFGSLDRIGGTIRIGGNGEHWYRHDWDPLEDADPPQPGTVGGIKIDRNAKLETVNGFGALRWFWSPTTTGGQNFVPLTIERNSALRRIDAFQHLAGSTSNAPEGSGDHDIWIKVIRNPALERLPRLGPIVDEQAKVKLTLFVVDNDALETPEGPSWSFQQAYFWHNASLRSLRGLRLERPRILSVIGNPELANLNGVEMQGDAGNGLGVRIQGNAALHDASALIAAREHAVRYRELDLLSNATLPQAEAQAVADASASESVKVAGNGGWIPLDPCPYVEDHECDEELKFERRVCALGSDEEDCAE